MQVLCSKYLTYWCFICIILVFIFLFFFMFRSKRVQGALLLLWLEIFFSLVWYVLLQKNYQQWTSSLSIAETLAYDIPSNDDPYGALEQDNHSARTSQSENDRYNWIFGRMYTENEMISDNGIIQEKERNHILLDQEKIVMHLLWASLYDQWLLDSSMLKFFISSSPEDISSLLTDWQYLFFNASFSFDEIIQHVSSDKTIIDDLVRSEDIETLVLRLWSLEQRINTLLHYSSNNLYSYAFSSTEAFSYIWDKLAVDSVDTYTSTIDTVSAEFWIDPYLIKAAIMTEQLRWLTTYRGIFKQILASNKYIMVMSQFSYGIWGIKEATALEVEERFSQNDSRLYDTFFAYDSTEYSSSTQRKARLTDTSNYYYQIAYIAGALSMYQHQWQQAGYDISRNSWILLTLYNVWYKEPNPHPSIWWATLTIGGEKYSFGSLSLMLYYFMQIYS